MVDELIKEMLESGVHFGHQTRRWNPKMKKFIFGQRSGIYIIDLEKTAACLVEARNFLKDTAAKGGRILFIGTKKQAQMIIEDEAKKADMYYIKNRWLGGLLTNFQTIRKSIERLNAIDRMKEDGTWENLKKKETSRLDKEAAKLLRDLGGIREMRSLPEAIFVVDPKKETIAIKEAQKLGIPIVAIIDTNCNPDDVNYPIPGNDDALKSVRLLTSLAAESVRQGRNMFATSGTGDNATKVDGSTAQPQEA